MDVVILVLPITRNPGNFRLLDSTILITRISNKKVCYQYFKRKYRLIKERKITVN